MSTTQDDHKENFEKFDEIKIDSSDTNKDIPEKEIKSCNLVKDFKTYKSFKTEKSESFGEGKLDRHKIYLHLTFIKYYFQSFSRS